MHNYEKFTRLKEKVRIDLTSVVRLSATGPTLTLVFPSKIRWHSRSVG